jgi:hypothetical protein
MKCKAAAKEAIKAMEAKKTKKAKKAAAKGQGSREP